MLLNALNSVNFTAKHNHAAKRQLEAQKAKEAEVRDYDEEELYDENESGALSPDQKGEVIKEAIERANANVHPATLAATAAAMVAAGASVTGATKLGRKFAVTLGESLSKAAVDAYAKTSKAGKKFDAASVQKAITEKATVLRDGSKDSKFLEGVHDFSAKVVGNDKADGVVSVLKKLGVKDGTSAFDLGAGVIAAGVVCDPVSDKAENHFDIKDVSAVAEALVS